MLAALFAVTLFLAAALLFLVEPLIGKRLLPLLGGTPAVWNTCLVFFNLALLAGYLYADRGSARLGASRLAGWHAVLLILPIVLFLLGWWWVGSPLPVMASLLPQDLDYPMLPLLGALAVALGLPFFVLATTSPLLMRWFALLSRRDPYPLYAASNAGSLLGLLAYPLVVEPLLPLPAQEVWWATAATLVFALIGLCALLARSKTPEQVAQPLPGTEPLAVPQLPALSWRRCLRWLGLAALPAALLLAVTAHLTSDIAPVPLLWVVPLALYLLTFIVVFSWWPDWLHHLVGRLTATALVVLVLPLVMGGSDPIVLVVALHLTAFVLAALLCHGELARDRPPAEQLTTFYLCLSLGGVLGTFACALLAPVVFSRLGLIEYPLAVVLVALVRPGVPWQSPRWSDVLLPLLLGLATAAAALGIGAWLGPPTDPNDIVQRGLRTGLVFGTASVLAFALVRRPFRFALALAAVLLVGPLDPGRTSTTILRSRNFFGALRVNYSLDGQFVQLMHGTTLHGQQRLEKEDSPTPLTYYHPTGPAGRLLQALPAERSRRVGLVGLGTGALAVYARPGQHWTFYEIDPAVVRIARDSGYFTYLQSSRGEVDIVLGDARRRLMETFSGEFDVLVIDAFSSDSIPVHLLTREAMRLYLDRLKPNGVLLLHLSNRYLDLPPLVARLAREFDPPLLARLDQDVATEKQKQQGKTDSTWVAVARSAEDLKGVATPPNWHNIPHQPGVVWTDDFSNLLGVWHGYTEN